MLACNTTSSRIRGQQALFDTYPPEIQQSIRDGHIEVGYTPEMVVMALGEPDHKIEAKPEDELGEIWTYRKSVPGFSIGMGTGSYLGSGVAIGSGVSTGTPSRSEDRALVEFWGGRVKRFEAIGTD
jgi:hypothetical protein